MPKTPSPFTGMKLTDQTPLAKPGIDQQLFSRPTPPPEPPKAQEVPPPKPQPPIAVKPPKRPAEGLAAAPAQGFDLTVDPYKPATFVFTAEELRGIEDIKTGLDRTFDLKATKIDIVRCAVHSIIHDYQTRGEDSLIVQRIREKNSH